MPDDFAIFTQVRTNIEGLGGKADGFPVEQHALEMTITSHPIETGAKIVDHAVKQPEKVSLEGVVSDLTPFESTSSDPVVRNAEAWQTIVKMMEGRQLVTVSSPIHIYTNMVITRATSRRDHSTGRGLVFSVDLEEIKFPSDEKAKFTAASFSSDSTSPAASRLAKTSIGREFVRRYIPEPIAQLAPKKVTELEGVVPLDIDAAQLGSTGKTLDFLTFEPKPFPPFIPPTSGPDPDSVSGSSFRGLVKGVKNLRDRIREHQKILDKQNAITVKNLGKISAPLNRLNSILGRRAARGNLPGLSSIHSRTRSLSNIIQQVSYKKNSMLGVFTI